ncbi:MAG: excinuclease ABC subunit UvrB [Clostridia bacterium]|nr:excinuclease ABC subunit UvrB [Clostridia bacterium]
MYELVSKYKPAGDQQQAIDSIVKGINEGLKEQVLQGVTGSGKTFTMANIIKQVNKPTLVLAHNKTLAGQLCNEFKEFFPNNRVEYFVSYYDYYQPEAYIAKSDTYIEKDSSVNDEIDKLRHSATSSLIETNNVIVVASVSCIYALGAPQEYYDMSISVREGQTFNRDTLIKKLIEIRYERNDVDFKRSTFRVKGDIIDIIPSSYNEKAIRIEFFDDTVERIYEFDIVSNKLLKELKHIAIFPATHYAVNSDKLLQALKNIESDRDIEVKKFKDNDKLIEAQRLKERVSYDVEMLREIGYCNGIENYSRYFDGRTPGQAPFTLLDYFKDDFLLFVDESHITLPQVRGMFNGDKARKTSLVDYGFRLKSAYDNRPLNFEEFNERINQVVYVSATPSSYELERAENVAVQVIRPTGLLDPEVEVRPSKYQVDDLIEEINKVIEKQGRVLITTLTKKMAESLTGYLTDYKIKVRYMHSDIDALERMDIINGLRKGSFDVLVGINLLREGLDIPEVMLVAILDADKEGFLRSETSLIQTIGRAARNSEAKVIMYADNITQSMQNAIDITNQRREIQDKFNKEHNIIPKTIIKGISSNFEISKKIKDVDNSEKENKKISRKDILSEIDRLKELMNTCVRSLDFESAIKLRDRIAELKTMLNE